MKLQGFVSMTIPVCLNISDGTPDSVVDDTALAAAAVKVGLVDPTNFSPFLDSIAYIQEDSSDAQACN